MNLSAFDTQIGSATHNAPITKENAMAYYIKPVSHSYSAGKLVGGLVEPDPGEATPVTRAILNGGEITKEMIPQLPSILRMGKDPDDDISCIIPVFSFGGGFAICQALKDIIEDLEPGVHQFFPMTITGLQSEADIGRYYLLHVTQKLDAIIYDKTAFAIKERFGLEAAKKAGFMLVPDRGPKYPCTLKKDVIAGKHLWRGTVGDKCLYRDGFDDLVGIYFCSDELAAAMRKRKILGCWDLFSCEVKIDYEAEHV